MQLKTPFIEARNHPLHVKTLLDQDHKEEQDCNQILERTTKILNYKDEHFETYRGQTLVKSCRAD